ncbi:MAG: FtsH protease activity modulator HflK [Janthinobacterium lividum]
MPSDDGPWSTGGNSTPKPLRRNGEPEPHDPWAPEPDRRPQPRPATRPGLQIAGADIEQARARARELLDRLRQATSGGGGGNRGPGDRRREDRGDGNRRGGGGDWQNLAGARGVAAGVAVLAALWLASGVFQVQPDQQGVVLRFGAYSRTVLPGLNYHLPWPVETVLRPSVTVVNRIEIGDGATDDADGDGTPDARSGPTGFRVPFATGRSSHTPAPAAEGQMLTGDENIIDISYAVFWRISDAKAFLFNTRNPAATVRAAAESVMREVLGRTAIQSALTEGRASIETSVRSGVQAILDAYGSGVEITQIQLQRVDPPPAVIESFRDVQRANTDAERMRNEAQAYARDIVPRARGEAASITAAADGDRQASIATATGQAQRFTSVESAYAGAKQVTLRRLYLEAMQDVLSRTPTIVVADGVRGLLPFLGLPGLSLPGAAPLPGAAGTPTPAAPPAATPPPPAAAPAGAAP